MNLKIKNSQKSKIKKMLRQRPFRGIISEIARQEGKSPSAIWQALYIRGDDKVVAMVEKKIVERLNRKNPLERLQKILGGIWSK